MSESDAEPSRGVSNNGSDDVDEGEDELAGDCDIAPCSVLPIGLAW
jgi:hypothetical protein